MSLLTKVKHFEDFANKYKHESDLYSEIKRNRELESVETIEKLLKEYQDDNKLLRIGIVGRVKAGKSSLLNALVFDGEDVLPKAATPMTAALTIMKYSQEMRAEVDFFTDEDIRKLKEEHQQYQQNFKRLEAEEMEAEKKKDPKRSDPAKAKRRAERRIKDSPYAASADQYERISKSGITSVSSLNEYRDIYADSMSELNQKLSDFVGANGKYMPFTKSVTLYLPEPKLEGLEIVDTPGINDPVQSRGKRTEDLLSQCDVVLMVSPAGQFLSEQDTALMSNMTTSKAIGHVYLVASQCDNQLFGNEYGDHNIQSILANIRTTLGKHATDTLSQEKQKYPDMEPIFDQFCQNELILTSGACYGLAKYLAQPEKWDETQQHVYKLLSGKFPQEFSTQTKSLSTLNMLSNTDSVQKVLDIVHQKKTEIIAEKTTKYQQAQSNALTNMIELLQNLLRDKEYELKNCTIETLIEEQARFATLKTSVNDIVSSTYQTHSTNLRDRLASGLKISLQQQMNKFVRGSTEKGYTERSESYEVKVGEESTSTWYKPWTWGDTRSIYETRYRTVRDEYSYVRATPVRESILTILDILNSQLTKKANSVIEDAKDVLNKELRSQLYVLDKDNFSPKRIENILNQVLDKLPRAEFELDSMPSSLDKYGELRGYEGDKFLQEAREYISELESNIQNQIDDYIQDLKKKLQRIHLSRLFISTFEEKLENLKRDIQNSEARIKEFQTMRDELNQI
ncbi:hypothetical protein B0186_09530 [Canicola haemoglobinophilus]|uniref:GTP-binding protein Der n=1 Tax=Canicola haemoglobinophilus TaxID=733 RepID=A0A1V4AZ91_9PAST|nr:dynamin family protein [Canicola haemoglobinophilus]OOR98288.1 hypothetical protein B0186_09530 [Canicola haemoglobinophilus]STO59226.1 GTP-binding protein Der [Canicola haemoglobinophilus]